MKNLIHLIHLIILTRLRKIVSKEDYFGHYLVILAYISISFLFFLGFEKIGGFYFLFFLDVIVYNIKRKDLELLKVSKKQKTIIFIEYLIYSFPFLIVLILKNRLDRLIIIVLIYLIMILLPKFSLLTIKYPFSLINPHWHIVFRNYRIVFWFPILYFLSYMGIKHNNENLYIFTLLIAFLIVNLPLFEREREIEIKYARYSSEDYLSLQLKKCIMNMNYVLVPLVTFIFILTLNINILLFYFGINILLIINVVLKYKFFYSPITQQIFIAIFIMSFGIPILIFPYLYKGAIKKINEIKYA